MAGYNPSFSDCDGPWKDTGPEPIENFQKQRLAEEIFWFVQGRLREFSSPLVSSWLMTVQHFAMKKVKDKSKFLVTRFQLTRVVLPEYLFKAQTLLLDKYGEDTHKLKINLQRYQRTFTQTGKARNRSHPSQIAFASAEEKSFKMRPVGLPGCFTPVGIEGFFVDFLRLGQHRVAVSNGNVFEWVPCCLKSCWLHLFYRMEMCSTGLVRYILDTPQ